MDFSVHMIQSVSNMFFSSKSFQQDLSNHPIVVENSIFAEMLGVLWEEIKDMGKKFRGSYTKDSGIILHILSSHKFLYDIKEGVNGSSKVYLPWGRKCGHYHSNIRDARESNYCWDCDMNNL